MEVRDASLSDGLRRHPTLSGEEEEERCPPWTWISSESMLLILLYFIYPEQISVTLTCSLSDLPSPSLLPQPLQTSPPLRRPLARLFRCSLYRMSALAFLPVNSELRGVSWLRLPLVVSGLNVSKKHEHITKIQLQTPQRASSIHHYFSKAALELFFRHKQDENIHRASFRIWADEE